VPESTLGRRFITLGRLYLHHDKTSRYEAAVDPEARVAGAAE
jgi:hypothetical protein